MAYPRRPLESVRAADGDSRAAAAGSHMQDKFPYSDFNAIVCGKGERREGRTSLSLSPLSPSLQSVFHFGLWADNDDGDGNLCESVQLSRAPLQHGRIDARRKESRAVLRCRAVETFPAFLPLCRISRPIPLSPSLSLQATTEL